MAKARVSTFIIYNVEVQIHPNEQNTGKEFHEALSDIACDQEGRTTAMHVTDRTDSDKNQNPRREGSSSKGETQQPDYW